LDDRKKNYVKNFLDHKKKYRNLDVGIRVLVVILEISRV
jgi:hypothetical protein